MSSCFTPPVSLRRALWAAVSACALAGPAMAADPAPSRAYPPTYSSRKAPWYDPFRLLTESDAKSAPPSAGSKPIPNAQVQVSPGSGTAPAWNWYGYGTPTPGGNPLAPAGAYAGVPGNWHTSSGTTPGAIPQGHAGSAFPGLVPDPVPTPRTGPQESTFASQDGPLLPPVGASPPLPAADANWSPAPASLRAPTPDRLATADPSAPAARLKPPVQADAVPVAGPTLDNPVPPSLRPPSDTPDIPVESAPGIVAPPPTGGVSRADRPLTVRGRAPEVDVAAAIRRACGTEVRVMDVVSAGPRRVVVRLAGDAWAARDRLARAPEVAGWRVEFERVTPLRP